MTTKSYATQRVRPSPLFLGIDIGTSGCRAVAIDENKIQLAESHFDYPQLLPQSPELWWQATQTVIKAIIAQTRQHHVEAIAIDGTSGTVFLCDASGNPLTPALMYHDQRATAQAQRLKRSAPKNSIVLNPASGLAKVLWLIEHYPPTQPFHIVHQADWVAGQLSRRFNFSDCNNALKTGYDAVNHHWPLWLSELWTNELKLELTALPEVYRPGEVISLIHPEVAKTLALPIDIDIVAGTTDSTAAFIASLNSDDPKPGDAVTSLGSTLVTKVVSEHPIEDVASGIYSQPYGSVWLVGGGSNSGGAVLRHYFSPQEMQELSKQVQPEKPTRLNYYPLIYKGERFPVNDPELQPRLTPRADNDVLFFQGMLEGIADIEHAGYQLLHQLGAPYPVSVKSAGGGAINKAWQDIRAKKLGVPVVCAQHSQAAYGSALLAAKNYLSKQGNHHDQ